MLQLRSGTTALAAAFSLAGAPLFAQTQEEMQKALNAQVMATPFNAGDIKKAEAEADKALKQGVVPQAQAPSYWAPGWTCANLTTYQYYNYGDYRNCIYYHRYYNRYWY